MLQKQRDDVLLDFSDDNDYIWYLWQETFSLVCNALKKISKKFRQLTIQHANLIKNASEECTIAIPKKS